MAVVGVVVSVEAEEEEEKVGEVNVDVERKDVSVEAKNGEEKDGDVERVDGKAEKVRWHRACHRSC